MKRLEQREAFAQRLPAASMYLDDVEVIVAEFQRYGHEVLFKDDEYEFENLGEVITVRGHRPSRLVITSRTLLGPALRFSRWSKMGLTLRQGANPSDRLLLNSIGEILGRRRNWLSRLLVPKVIGTLSVIAFLAMFAVPETAGGKLFLASVVLFVLWAFATEVETGMGSTLNLAHRHATTSFWSRHAEKVIYIVLGAVAGSTAKYLFDRFLP